MGKYKEQSVILLNLIGGKENIYSVTHCVTRIRFVLIQPEKADVASIERIKQVKGTFTQAGQFQVIIGQDVQEFYNDFINIAEISGDSGHGIKNAVNKSQSVLQKTMSTFSEIFTPLIPALVAAGLLLSFQSLLECLCFDGIAGQYPIYMADVYSVLKLLCEAVFQMLPVGICWSITKKMGTSQILGIVLGCMLVYGQLANASLIVPAILAGFCLAYLEKFFAKICPKIISVIFVPFFSLLLAAVTTHFVLGPIGWKIGSWISSGVYAAFTSDISWIVAGVAGMLYAPLVVTGFHHITNVIDIQLVVDYGGTILWPLIVLSNIAQGSAVLGMIFLQKNNAERKNMLIQSCVSCYFGVTESAIFGVNLKQLFPFFCGMIGSCLAAIVSVTSGIMANSIGVGGIPGILSIKVQHMGQFLFCSAIAIIVPFVLTSIIGKKLSSSDLSGNEAMSEPIVLSNKAVSTNASNQITEMRACVSGRIINLSEVNDGVFSAGVVGEGIAIIPNDNVVVAPCHAKITAVMTDSKHALGLTLENGVEILIHVGIDTIEMKGDGFAYWVSEGQNVSTGEILMTFDRKKIDAAGKKMDVIFVVTDNNGRDISFIKDITALMGDTIVGTIK